MSGFEGDEKRGREGGRMKEGRGRARDKDGGQRGREVVMESREVERQG